MFQVVDLSNPEELNTLMYYLERTRKVLPLCVESRNATAVVQNFCLLSLKLLLWNLIKKCETG